MRIRAALTAVTVAVASTLVWTPAASAATLSPPSSVTATVAATNVAVGEGRITGSWGAVSGALAYALSARSGGVVVATTTVTAPVTTATLTGLTGGTTYDIVVQTGNADGFGSASTPIQATALTVPRAPAVFSVTSDTSTTTVTWTEPANGGSAITSYSITQGPSGTPVSVAAPTLSYTFSNTTFTNASDYTVTATNSVGTSATGSAASTTPSAPRALSLTGTSTSVTATWQAPASTGGAAISSYAATLLSGGSVVSSTTVTDLSSLQATFSGLPTGTFQVQVTARNSNGSGLPASSSIAITSSGGTAPSSGSASSASTSVVTSTGAQRPSSSAGSGSEVTAGSGQGSQAATQPTATIPTRVATRAGRRVSVTLTNAINIKPNELVVRLKRGKAKAKNVKFRARENPGGIRLTFTAPKKAGTYRMRILQRGPKGFFLVGSSRVVVTK